MRLVAGLALGLGASHLLWAARDTRPPPWDRAIHLELALRCERLLASGDWGQTLALSDFYPPLAHCLAGALHTLLGSSPLIALLVTQAALAATMLATAAIGVRLGAPIGGVAAALLVGVYAEVLLESRVFMLDLPLTALVTLVVLTLVRGEGLTDPRRAGAAGVLAGLALLTKWTAAFFLLPVGVFVAFRGRTASDHGRRGRGLVLFLALAAFVAAPWYLRHPLLPVALLGRAYRGAEDWVPPLTSLHGWTYYIAGLVDGLGPPFAILFGLGLALSRRVPGLGLLAVWVAGPLAGLTLLRNKDFRFVVPLLPAVALWSTAWLDRVGTRRAWGVVGGLALLAGVHAAYLGWGWPWPDWAQGRMDRRLLFPSFPPLAEDWPIRAVAEAAVRDRPPGPRPLVLSVAPDAIYFSRDVFRYEATRHALPLRVTGAFDGTPLGIDYLVTKTGDQGPARTTGATRRLMARVDGGDAALVPMLDRLAEWPLPDGGRATLYRIEPRPVDRLTATDLAARLRGVDPAGLAWVARDVRGLRIEVEIASDADARVGRLRRALVSAESVRVGDFRRRPAAIRVHEMELQLDGARLNPHALTSRGAVELLGVERITVRRAAVRDQDLAEALAETVPWLDSPRIAIRDGRLALAMGIGPVPLEVTLRAAGTPAGLPVEVAGFRIGPVPVWAWVARQALAAMDPATRARDWPVRVEIPRVRLDGGWVRLESPNGT